MSSTDPNSAQPVEGTDSSVASFMDPRLEKFIVHDKPLPCLFPTDRGGYVDNRGTVVIPDGTYTFTGDFQEGTALVAHGPPDRLQCHYMDESGSPLISLAGTYDMEHPLFHPEVAVMGDGLMIESLGENHWQYVDRQGEFALEMIRTPQVRHFSQGLAAFQTEEGLWGYQDHASMDVIEPTGFTEAFHFSGGVARVCVLDEAGRDRVMYINPSGANILGDRQFAQGSDVVEGTMAVQSPDHHNLWGILNTQGQWIIEPQYAWAAPFSEGLAAVLVGTESTGYAMGFVDASATMVIPPQFVDHPHGLHPKGPTRRYRGRHLYTFYNGIAALGGEVPEKGLCYIDRQGERVC